MSTPFLFLTIQRRNINMITTAQLLAQFKAKQVKFVDGLQVMKASRTVMDIFTGLGWQSHSRYRLVKGRWLHVQGAPLSTYDLSRVENV